MTNPSSDCSSTTSTRNASLPAWPAKSSKRKKSWISPHPTDQIPIGGSDRLIHPVEERLDAAASDDLRFVVPPQQLDLSDNAGRLLCGKVGRLRIADLQGVNGEGVEAPAKPEPTKQLALKPALTATGRVEDFPAPRRATRRIPPAVLANTHPSAYRLKRLY